MRKRRSTAGSQSGMAIVLVLMTAFVGFLMVAGVLALSTQNSRLVWRDVALSRSDATTDAALEAAVGIMVRDLHSQGVAGVSNNVAGYGSWVSTVVGAAISNTTLDDFTVVSLLTTNYGEVTWRITAQTEADDPDPVPSRASLDLRMLDVPVTGFSLCYDVDLEHYPWHDWVVNGPVYCGQRAYFCPDSGANLTFADQVFSVGGIVHGPHPLDPGAALNGTIEYASERNAQSPTMVQPPPPAGETNRMHWVLERPVTSDYGTPTGDQRFYNKADIVVEVDTTGNVSVRKGPKHGNVFLSSTLPASVMYTTNIYDGREVRTANLVVLDAAMVPSWMVSAFGAARPTHPTIYIANNKTWGAAAKFSAVRVENGLVLGDAGFTLATPNPLYVRGPFNSINPKPSLLAGDSVTVLSGAWNDGDGLLGILDAARAASDTTINAAVITGIVPANGTYGSGWVANILRLLENWDGRLLAFNGSLAVLYHSEMATGVFYHGTYYRAPAQRTFSFTNYFSGMIQTNVPALKMALRQNYRQLPPL